MVASSGCLCCYCSEMEIGRVVDSGGFCSVLWSRLPVDLWFEVFSRLPLDKLVQLRCINKAFYSSITHLFIPRLAVSAPISGFIFNWQSIFIAPEYFENDIPREEELPGRHVRYSPSPGVEEEDFVIECFHDYVATCHDSDGDSDGCFNLQFIKYYSSLLPFKMESETDNFLGCFSGIILVTNSSSTSAHVSYYLCNPATKQCITIPVNPTHLKNKNKKPFVGLAFDPLDPPPHHFKIVQFTQHEADDEEKEQTLNIFSSATGKWVKHTICLDDDEILRSELVRHFVYLNGQLYMLSMAKHLLCFDLGESYNSNDAKLKGCAIKLPHTSSTMDDSVRLFGSSNGCLFYACYVKYDLFVWTFQPNNQVSPWRLKYHININEVYELSKGGLIFSGTFIIYAVDLRREVVFFGVYNYVWSYNIKTNKLNFICILDAGSILHAENGFYPYSPCLVKLPDCFSIADKVLTEPFPCSLF